MCRRNAEDGITKIQNKRYVTDLLTEVFITDLLTEVFITDLLTEVFPAEMYQMDISTNTLYLNT